MHLAPLALLVLAALPGCAPAETSLVYIVRSEWTPSETATVGSVSWDPSGGAGTATVEYGLTTDYGAEAPATTSGEALLLGLVPDTTYHYRLVGDGWVSEDATLATAPAPDALPRLDLLESDGSDWGRYTLTTTSTDVSVGQVQVLDAALNPVWWYEVPAFVASAALGRDGSSIVYLQGSGGVDAELVRVAFDGVERSRQSVPFGHHAFVELPNSDVAYLEFTVRNIDGVNLVGDRIVVISPLGESRVVFDSFDELLPDDAADQPKSTSLGTEWFHANGLAYDERDNTFLVSSAFLEAVYKVDASTGNVLWQLGGEGSDFDFPDDQGFGVQHAPEVTEDGVLLFDNGGADGASRAVEFDLDAKAGTASRVTEAVHPSGAWVATLGDATRLPSGAIGTTWAERGESIVFNEDGTVAWHADLPDGQLMFGMQVFDSFYP